MTNMLSIGRSALLAYGSALTTVGENVANAQTPGYVRRSADLREAPPSRGLPLAGGNGVRVAGVERQWNQFLADTARNDAGSAAREGLRYDGAKQIEAALDDGIGGVGQSMTSFFNAARTLATDPSSIAGQAQLRSSLGGVTNAFRRSAASLDSVVSQSNGQVDARLAGASQQLTELAAVNQRIAATHPNSTEFAALSDSRDTYLSALSQSLGASASIDAQGRAVVTLDSGSLTLLSGTSASTLQRTESGAISAASDRGTSIAASIGGEIGGIQATIVQADERRSELDSLAVDFAAAVNSWSVQGRTVTGAPGQPLIDGSSAADIATTNALAGALPMADAATGAANGNLVALAEVRQSSQLEQRWDGIIAGHAQFTANAKIVADASQLLADGSASRLDAATAVDLDAEAADLVRYQQAYQAAARVIRVADEALDSLLQII